MLISTLKQASLTDIDKSGAVILFNIQPGRSYPILEMKIRHAAKNGVRLYIINDRPLRLDEYADSVFRIRKNRYKKFLDLTGYIRYISTSEAPAAAEYYSDLKIDGALPLELRIKQGKITDFIRNTLDKHCIFISDEDTTRSRDIEAFIMNALVQKDSAKLILMRRGTNPEGAFRFSENKKADSIDTDTLKKFDTLLLYKLPEIFQNTQKDIVHIGFKPGSYRRGVFIPASSMLESGGMRYLYNGKLLPVQAILKNESALNNVKTLENLITRVSGV